MTYVTEQTSCELRAHMRRLQAMPGWHNPLDDRLYKEVLEQDAEIARLREALSQRTEQQADPWRQAVDDALIAHALDCTGPGDDPKEKVKELLEWAVTIATDPRVSEQATAAPTVEQAVEALKVALRDSKGWMMDYSDSIIRDAIDRVPAGDHIGDTNKMVTAAREQEAGCAACVTCGQPWPEASAKGAEPERFCNKCGYFGPDELHQRPNGTGKCGYFSVPTLATPTTAPTGKAAVAAQEKP